MQSFSYRDDFFCFYPLSCLLWQGFLVDLPLDLVHFCRKSALGTLFLKGT